MAEAQRTGMYLQRFPDSGAPIPFGTKLSIKENQRPDNVSIKAAKADHTGKDVSYPLAARSTRRHCSRATSHRRALNRRAPCSTAFCNDRCRIKLALKNSAELRPDCHAC